MTTIEHKLDALADLQSQKDVISLQKQAVIDSVLTPEIRQKLADIDAEFAGKSEFVDAEIARLTDSVKTEVLLNGATVKGNFLMAVYTKGRETWDGKGLAGFMVAHPEIEKFRKVGEPSISIRKI